MQAVRNRDKEGAPYLKYGDRTLTFNRDTVDLFTDLIAGASETSPLLDQLLARIGDVEQEDIVECDVIVVNDRLLARFPWRNSANPQQQEAVAKALKYPWRCVVYNGCTRRTIQQQLMHVKKLRDQVVAVEEQYASDHDAGFVRWPEEDHIRGIRDARDAVPPAEQELWRLRQRALYGYGGGNEKCRVIAVPFNHNDAVIGCFFLVRYDIIASEGTGSRYTWYFVRHSVAVDVPKEMIVLLNEYMRNLWESFGWRGAPVFDGTAVQLPQPVIAEGADRVRCAVALTGTTFGMIRSHFLSPSRRWRTADEPTDTLLEMIRTNVAQKKVFAVNDLDSATRRFEALETQVSARLFTSLAHAYIRFPHGLAELFVRSGDPAILTLMKDEPKKMTAIEAERYDELLQRLQKMPKTMTDEEQTEYTKVLEDLKGHHKNMTQKEAARYDHFIAHTFRVSTAQQLQLLADPIMFNSHFFALSRLGIRRLLHHYTAVTYDPVYLRKLASV